MILKIKMRTYAIFLNLTASIQIRLARFLTYFQATKFIFWKLHRKFKILSRNQYLPQPSFLPKSFLSVLRITKQFNNSLENIIYFTLLLTKLKQIPDNKKLPILLWLFFSFQDLLPWCLYLLDLSTQLFCDLY